MTDALMLTPTYPWRDEPGIGIFYRTQAKALMESGARITVACPTPWAPWPLGHLRTRWRHHADAPLEADDDGVRILRPRYPNVPGAPSWAHTDRFMAGAVWRARAGWEGAEVVHGHYALTGLAAWKIARRAGLPLFLTFHGSDMNSWPDENPDRVADLRSVAREAAMIFAVSRALAARARDVTGVDAVYLPLGSDHAELERGSLPRDQARSLLGLPDDRIVVLFVGNLKPTKGVRALAEALLDLGDPFLGVFVGGGPEDSYGMADPRAQGRLEYRGPQPHPEVIRYMSAADVLVLPSESEGLPTVIVEAGSLGLPVIASSVGGIPELLGTDRGTMLADTSSASIAAALTHFRDDPAGATLAAGRLRALVREEHDSSKNTARLMEAYEAAVARRQGAPGSRGG